MTCILAGANTFSAYLLNIPESWAWGWCVSKGQSCLSCDDWFIQVAFEHVNHTPASLSVHAQETSLSRYFCLLKCWKGSCLLMPNHVSRIGVTAMHLAACICAFSAKSVHTTSSGSGSPVTLPWQHLHKLLALKPIPWKTDFCHNRSVLDDGFECTALA